MQYEKAGDPMTGLFWTKKTLQKISKELAKNDIKVGKTTVAKLLKKMNYSLKCNDKKVSNGGKKLTKEEKLKRDQQFKYIEKMRKMFTRNGLPQISVDTKKKEMIGNFKNPGTRYRKEGDLTNDHDFITYAVGKAFPYGIYDVYRNEGFVYVGQALWDKEHKRFSSSDTPEFAAENIARWWQDYGQDRYPEAKELLILADSGGSNGNRTRMWKLKLNELMCNKYGLKVTVCHYPAGASKWNPIEHHLFSEISKNWQGTPLRSFETVLKYIRTTKTKTGLKVNARIVKKVYEKGMAVPNELFGKINLQPHKTCPERNYSLIPDC